MTACRYALLEAIARGRCVSSRGRLNPRGVKRKTGNFNVRHRGEPLHQRHQPTPSADAGIAYLISIGERSSFSVPAQLVPVHD
jgi:hypothetical protein